MSTAASTSGPLTTGTVTPASIEQLPDDPAVLKQMILELLATLQEERRDKDDLRHRLDLLLRRLYGPRSERFDPNQPLLFGQVAEAQGQDTTAATDDQSASSKLRRRARPHGRRRLPENLERRPVHHELTERERLCVCGQMRVDIGADVSEQLDWQPASLFIRQHHVHKYACLNCAKKVTAAAPTPPAAAGPSEAAKTPTTEQPSMATTEPAPTVPTLASNRCEPADTPPAVEEPVITSLPSAIGPVVVSASKPAMPIAKGMPGAGLLAHLIVSKHTDHLPLYRQERMYERQGVFIPRSTTCDWMAASAELLRPLYGLMVSLVLQSRVLHTDDTPVKNQQPPPEATATARFWGYLGDAAHAFNVFDFTTSRKRDGPEHFLANFRGYLQADAFSGYDGLYLPNPRDGVQRIIEVACNAHARRKFHEARTTDMLRAHQTLAYYRQLYEIERRPTVAQADEVLKLRMRQELAVPILDKFHTWLEQQRVDVLPKSPMAEAIGYALNNWTALIRYTEAGCLAIDNNVAEREMKRIAISRKNWLFVGSERGGHTAAVLISFTSTCQRLGVEPWAYLQDVLARLPTTPADRLAELLPDRWKAARASAATNPPAPAS